MRVRVVHSLSGVMNGLPLSPLVPGFVYDLDEDIAQRLLELRAVVQVRSTDLPTDVSLEDVDISWLTGGVHVSQPEPADDRRSRPPPAERRKTGKHVPEH